MELPGQRNWVRDDNASPIIDDVMDKASAWDGSVFTATHEYSRCRYCPNGELVLKCRKESNSTGRNVLWRSAGLADTVNTYKGFESDVTGSGYIWC